MKGDSIKTREYGLMAQDVQQYFPEMVKTIDNEDHLGLSYTQLIPVLLEAIKEQQEELELLKKENKKLKKQCERIDTLESKLSRLEAVLDHQ